MTKKKKAVVLSSGGLDSTTVMAISKQAGYEIYCLSFDYGQRHSFELNAAKKIADITGAAKHLIISVDLRIIGGSALTDNTDVPKGRDEQDMADEIPVTYVPARNTIFLSYALAWAEVIRSSDIFIGINAVDYSGYPDCRPEYLESFEHMANLATKAGVEGITKIKIHAPLMTMSKAQIIKKGVELGVDYSLTHSCYDPDVNGLACGECDSCLLRKKGFKEAGIADPTKYKER
ncbi:MAG: 7-cyano-7-deazaguanine synthase QueC [Desulfobacterales bacterium]|nr:7-cyano-7-deazaguanine synthase QueC [Desulfobacterales bacterium]